MGCLLLVAGALANKPCNGGAAWTRMSWVTGLARLGFEVFFLEEISPGHCRDSTGRVVPLQDSVNFAFFRQVTREFGLEGSAALLTAGADRVEGATRQELLSRAEAAAGLLNISGHLRWPTLLGRVRRRIYLDLDPGYTQIWHAQGMDLGLGGHHMHFTIGENLGTSRSPIPGAGFRWLKTRQPVVLEQWPVRPHTEPARFTTVASWRGAYGPLRFGGRRYGAKAHEFRRFARLPSQLPCRFELALEIGAGETRDLSLLREHGWDLVDPAAAVPDPGRFRRYVQGSLAEFSAAQGVYAGACSGWFSDRSVHYLASGKPVVVQDTGWPASLPRDEGIFAVRDCGEAARAVGRVLADYPRQSRRAREAAEEFFDSRTVLARFAADAGLAP